MTTVPALVKITTPPVILAGPDFTQRLTGKPESAFGVNKTLLRAGVRWLEILLYGHIAVSSHHEDDD
jgi:hypothetical protein